MYVPIVVELIGKRYNEDNGIAGQGRLVATLIALVLSMRPFFEIKKTFFFPSFLHSV
jgi:hypothetical protein